MLAQLVITDQTFGELCIDINSFDCLPKTLKLQNLQWKLTITKYDLNEDK